MGSRHVDAQGYVPVLLENLCSMSCSGTYWLLGCGWFQCRYGGFWMISYYLIFPVVRSFLCSQALGLSVLPLDFSLILPVASRLLKLYSTHNRTSRLIVKRFSPVRDTQRGSQSHMKKRRETDLPSYLFPKCSPQPRHPQRFIEFDWVEKGNGGNRGVLRQKMESQDWERVFNTLLNKNGN